MPRFRFDALQLPAEAQEVRARARAFLLREREQGRFAPHTTSWVTFDAEFSHRAGGGRAIRPRRRGG